MSDFDVEKAMRRLEWEKPELRLDERTFTAARREFPGAGAQGRVDSSGRRFITGMFALAACALGAVLLFQRESPRKNSAGDGVSGVYPLHGAAEEEPETLADRGYRQVAKDFYARIRLREGEYLSPGEEMREDSILLEFLNAGREAVVFYHGLMAMQDSPLALEIVDPDSCLDVEVTTLSAVPPGKPEAGDFLTLKPGEAKSLQVRQIKKLVWLEKAACLKAGKITLKIEHRFGNPSPFEKEGVSLGPTVKSSFSVEKVVEIRRIDGTRLKQENYKDIGGGLYAKLEIGEVNSRMGYLPHVVVRVANVSGRTVSFFSGWLDVGVPSFEVEYPNVNCVDPAGASSMGQPYMQGTRNIPDGGRVSFFRSSGAQLAIVTVNSPAHFREGQEIQATVRYRPLAREEWEKGVPENYYDREFTLEATTKVASEK